MEDFNDSVSVTPVLGNVNELRGNARIHILLRLSIRRVRVGILYGVLGHNEMDRLST